MLILPGAISSQDIEFAVLPFNRVGNLIYVEAIVDEQSGYFLIDTGYRGVLLNKTYYDGMPTDLHLQGSNGIGGRLEYKNVDLRLGLLNVENIDANVADLSKLTQSIGIPLHGMIGSTFFQDFELMIDYRNNNVVLIKLDRNGEKTVELPTIVAPTDTLSFHFKGHLPVISVHIGGREFHLGIDTGAAANLFRSDSWSKLEEFVWDEREQFLRGLGTMRRKTKSGMLSEVHFEDIPFRSMRTLFGNIGHINRDLAGPNLDGIVGYEFLHQYTMAFNYRKQELYLWRVEPIEDAAEVDYTADNRDK
ncbi:hypothetical protein CRP01_27760 [Flavilitoribacter nigricans DSM 23189 = NBRC 102662]|uniref:Aspartyl protease n=2 Tax=Flavilitoribacter TaxID=2762562 RepID=A0A2D0N3W1_FLAN2|nr:hypothetical protein CRP01_27760 [Flavilitoribacter nigricans DSM 23189 = NBRC 102662]